MSESQAAESSTQSVCVRCGVRLSSVGWREVCVRCLLRSALDQEDVDPGSELQRSDDELPVEFGDYELLEEVGRGGQGVVYRALPWFMRLTPNYISEPTQSPSTNIGRYTFMGDLNRFPGFEQPATGCN